MARKLTALLLGVMLLLCGCGSPGAASATGEETVELVGQPYDYDLTEYLELRDETILPQNLWKRAEEDSLRGLFLRQLREKLESAETKAEREIVRQAARFGLAALEGRDLV